MMSKEIKVVLIGMPNVGKTALINSIAGTKLKVGNWPGVTLDKKEAILSHDGVTFHCIDLPGIHSLLPFSDDEEITYRYLQKNKPDCIVNVIDATNLRRNLFLTLQIASLNIPTVIALNFWNSCKKEGYKIHLTDLEKVIQIPIVPLEANKKKTAQPLLESIIKVTNNRQIPIIPNFDNDVEEKIKELCHILEHSIKDHLSLPPRLEAILFLSRENNSLTTLCNKTNTLKNFLDDFKNYFGKSSPLIIAEQYLKIINNIIRKNVSFEPRKKKEPLSDTIDRITLHPFFGIPIFLVTLYLGFKIIFDGSVSFTDWIDSFVNDFLGMQILHILNFFHVPQWIESFFLDGLISGIGTVLMFIPLMISLYFFLSLLEESGYMTRAAFVMDRILQPFGLNGKSFVPLLIGFGCNVPAIYTTRTLNNKTEKKIVALLISFMSCGAKLPLYALLTATFFTDYQALIVVCLYFLGITVAMVWAYILKIIFLHRFEEPLFYIELPPYRIPTWRMIWTSVWSRLQSYILQAGTTIILVTILMWALLNLPHGAPSNQTVLAKASRTIAPIFMPLGFGEHWQPVASIIPGFLAKEAIVGSLAASCDISKNNDLHENKSKLDHSPPLEKASFSVELIKRIQDFGIATEKAYKNVFSSFIPGFFTREENNLSALKEQMQTYFTPLSALSFMVFNLLVMSCVATFSAIRQEFGKKFAIYAFGFTCLTAYLASFLVYNIGKLLTPYMDTLL